MYQFRNHPNISFLNLKFILNECLKLLKLNVFHNLIFLRILYIEKAGVILLLNPHFFLSI